MNQMIYIENQTCPKIQKNEDRDIYLVVKQNSFYILLKSIGIELNECVIHCSLVYDTEEMEEVPYLNTSPLKYTIHLVSNNSIKIENKISILSSKHEDMLFKIKISIKMNMKEIAVLFSHPIKVTSKLDLKQNNDFVPMNHFVNEKLKIEKELNQYNQMNNSNQINTFQQSLFTPLVIPQQINDLNNSNQMQNEMNIPFTQLSQQFPNYSIQNIQHIQSNNINQINQQINYSQYPNFNSIQTLFSESISETTSTKKNVSNISTSLPPLNNLNQINSFNSITSHISPITIENKINELKPKKELLSPSKQSSHSIKSSKTSKSKHMKMKEMKKLNQNENEIQNNQIILSTIQQTTKELENVNNQIKQFFIFNQPMNEITSFEEGLKQYLQISSQLGTVFRRKYLIDFFQTLSMNDFAVLNEFIRFMYRPSFSKVPYVPKSMNELNNSNHFNQSFQVNEMIHSYQNDQNENDNFEDDEETDNMINLEEELF